MEKSSEHIELEAAFRELQHQLEEANDIINAIRSGEVDALVVNGKDGHQLFTLKSADHSYRIFIEQMTEGALTLDESGHILYCNSRFADLFDFPLEKIIGRRFLDFVPENDKIFVAEVIDGSWEVDTKTEIALCKVSGDTVPVQLSLKALKLDEATALSIIITDLTDLKKNEQLLERRNIELEEARRTTDELNENLEMIVRQRTDELYANNQELNKTMLHLKESEDNLQSAFNAGELGSCSLDLRSGRVEISERFRDLYGLPLTGEIQWEMLLEPVEAEFLPGLKKVLDNCMQKGIPIDSSYAIKHLITGERRWMRMVGKAKQDPKGDFIGVYAVLMDVTDQKQDEQRKNDFIAMVSHELKTPLTSMKGYIQVLQLKASQENNGFAVKALTGAERQVTKMTNMINGFLNISRLESGKIMMDFQKTDLSALAYDILEEYKTTGSNQVMHFNGEPGLIVNVDYDKLGHVINNLISNAIKYSPANTNIYIDCMKDGNCAKFQIRDEGMGIKQADLPKLFERFFRADSPQMATVSGFGIGLYLSAEIIARHGGKIWAESEIGVGSVFNFTIPLVSS